jgi:hypothetical protein
MSCTACSFHIHVIASHENVTLFRISSSLNRIYRADFSKTNLLLSEVGVLGFF